MMQTDMEEEPGPKDPFLEVENLLGKARDETARKVQAWQKAHLVTKQGFQLVQQFNEERQKLEPSGQIETLYSTFANVSGVSFVDLAADLQKPEDPAVTLGTSRVLLSGLQSNIASYVSSPIDFGVKNPFLETSSILKAQEVPLEARLSALSRRIREFSPHFSEMIRGVEQDLLNETNPLTMSNAAKNLREVFRAFIHRVAPDGTVELWPDCEVDPNKKRPTRKSRLGFHAFLGMPKAHWPRTWIEQVAKRVRAVLDSFDELNKFTHINEETAGELQTARVSLDTFVNEFLLYLDAAAEANEIFHVMLQTRVENELQQLAEGELHSWFEEGVSHAYTDAAYCEELRVHEITDKRIAFSGRCRVTGTFQRGSNSDLRRGDGAEWNGSRCFTFRGTASTASFDDINITSVEFLADGD
jgi:hypothetical protein